MEGKDEKHKEKHPCADSGGGGAILIALLAFSLVACNSDISVDGTSDTEQGSDSSGDSSSSGDIEQDTVYDAGGHVLVDDPSEGGVGYTTSTDEKTYYVYTAEGLVKWMTAATSDPSISCTLYNCIDMSGQGTWTPVYGYTGTFDGGGHTVSGLVLGTVERASTTYAGFFGRIASSGTVKNLGVSIESFSSIAACAGGIAGENSGSITACYSTGDVTGDSAGGIAGNNEGTITACYSTGDVTASNYAGGIAGYNYGGTITACYWSGTVKKGNNETNVGVGYGSGSTENVAKVGENDVTWSNGESSAMSQMNAQLQTASSEWRYTTTGATDDAPLKLTQSS